MTVKKTVSLILALVMILSCAAIFSSCSKKIDGTDISKLKKTKREHVYSEQLLENCEIPGYVSNIFASDDAIVMTYDRTYTLVMDEDGEEIERFEGYYYNYNSGEIAVDGPVLYDDIVYSEAASSSVTVTNGTEETVAPADISDEEAQAPMTEETVEEPVAAVDIDIAPALPEPTQGDEYKPDGDPDEFGVIIDENYNIWVPDGMWCNYLTEQVISRAPLDGGETTEVVIDNKTAPEEIRDGWMRGLFMGADGKVKAIYNVDRYDEETYIYTNEYFILAVDMTTGALSDMKCLNDCYASAGINPEDAYINNIVMLSDGNYYFNVNSGSIYVVDGDMKLVKKIELGEGYINSMNAVGDTLFVGMYDVNWTKMSFYTIVNGQVTPIESDDKLSDMMYSTVGGYGSKVFFRKDTGVAYFDTATGETGEELNFINSDIDYTNLSNLTLIGEGKFLKSSTDWSVGDGKTTVSILTKVPDEEIKEEVILTVGSIYGEYSLIKAIMAYNKQSDGVRITVKTYDSYNNQENEWTGARTQLNNEIVTGALPDIVMLDYSLPVQSYFQKGVFVDLNKYIDSEEYGIDRTKYYDNIFRANEINGRMYSMIVSYNVNTLAAKPKFVGNEKGWTFDEFMNAVKNMPEGMEAFFGSGRNDVFESVVNMGMSGLVDWETGNTKFDTQAFRDFITYLKDVPEMGIWEAFYDEMEKGGDEYIYDEAKDREISENMALRFWNDKSLFDNVSLYAVESISYPYREFGSRDITFIGLPTDDETSNGAVIQPEAEFAISAKTEAKLQAWDFIKFYLETYDPGYGLSVSKENVRKQADTALENAKREQQYIGSYVNDYEWLKQMGYSEDYINFQINSQVTLDEEMVETFFDILENVKTVVRTDEELVDIINEELSGFYAGTKSAEDTSKVIASRARTLIATKS